MSFQIVIPDSIFGGYYWRGKKWTFGILAHSLQCGQRWIFLIRRNHVAFGYRTVGDATPNLMTYKDAGFRWPWQTKRTYSGRW